MDDRTEWLCCVFNVYFHCVLDILYDFKCLYTIYDIFEDLSQRILYRILNLKKFHIESSDDVFSLRLGLFILES